jgi:hypothetical protein
MFLGGGICCCLANICLVVILNVEDPLVTLANPYDLIVVVPSKDHTQKDEEVRDIAREIIRSIIEKEIGEKVK